VLQQQIRSASGYGSGRSSAALTTGEHGGIGADAQRRA
jgi:hypothetical protein